MFGGKIKEIQLLVIVIMNVIVIVILLEIS